MTFAMDGSQVFSGNVTVPPVAYLYGTASTGGAWEDDWRMLGRDAEPEHGRDGAPSGGRRGANPRAAG